jgi:isocitrate dehydrogenase kinase/phosphatase
MADTQEFTNLAFARDRFSDELMEELRERGAVASHGAWQGADHRHLYVERRMTPLNLYLQDARTNDVDAVMDEYGTRSSSWPRRISSPATCC